MAKQLLLLLLPLLPTAGFLSVDVDGGIIDSHPF
jgi:hypothetical protein